MSFNLEIQSEHFGNGRSLSIEGSAIESYSSESLALYNAGLIPKERIERKMEFHSHFSDLSRQDAATTTAHMTVLFNHLFREQEIQRGKTIVFDETDGCSKQYRSGTAIYLLSLLSQKYSIVIDRAIGAPGHGKDVVDGLNAVDKSFLRKKCV